MAPSTAPSRCPECRLTRRGPPPYRQRGVALIASLTVLAIAVVAATTMAYQVYVNTRRTQNVVAAEQAWLYARTAEPAAIALLGLDRADGEVDYRAAGLKKEPWYTTAPFPKQMADGATLRFAIDDLQARLNLNGLGDEDGGEAAREQLNRLIADSGVRTTVQQLPAAVADWIDPDTQPRFPGGAEDDIYTRRTPGYRAANHPMVDTTELRLVRGMEGDEGRALWNAVCPSIAALPDPATPINVNTASAAVLRSLAPGLDTSTVAEAVKQRADEPYADVADFLARNQGFALPALASGRLTVSSEYFLVHGQATMGRAQVDLYSVIHRPADGPIEVIYRSRTPPERARDDETESNDTPPEPCIGTRLAF